MLRVPFSKLWYDESQGLYTYEGVPFVGVALGLRWNGTLESETEYRDGVRNGLERAWHEDGSLAAEGTFLGDVIVGAYREWHPNGLVALELVGEHGITISEKNWDEQGQLTKEYYIQEGGDDWQTLQLCRKLLGDRL